MAGALKQSFLEAVRLTPDGIADFLETAIPDPPTISTPADVDAAIIASGVLSKYLLDFFKPFAGLTPVELLLRIGQHNSVLESAMIAGLEYLGDDAGGGGGGGGGAEDFVILEPEAGGAYLPGSLRLVAKVSNGTVLQIAVEVPGASPTALGSDDGITFYGFVRLEDVGEYAATFTALFEDDSTQSANVSFSISNDPDAQNPDGSGLDALEAARGILRAAIAEFSKLDATLHAESQPYIDRIVGAGRDLLRIGGSILAKLGASAGRFHDDLGRALDSIGGSRSISRSRAILLDENLLLKVADIGYTADAYTAAVVAEYWKNNQHPEGGYTSCPETLRNAAIAMNDKYGPGTVGRH